MFNFTLIGHVFTERLVFPINTSETTKTGHIEINPDEIWRFCQYV